MTRIGLWRLEVIRLIRTRRWIALATVFVGFGLAGPLAVRYMDKLLAQADPRIVIKVPPPTPADGMASFLGNATQLGVLTLVLIAAAALCVDAKPGLSIFYRTRVRRRSDLVLPRYTVIAASGVLTYLAGWGAAWYETAVLIGSPEVGRTLVAALPLLLYLVFVVAVVSAVASLLRGVLATVGVSLAVLLGLPALGLISSVRPWLPSALTDASRALLNGGHDWSSAAVGTVVVTTGLLTLACNLAGRREIT